MKKVFSNFKQERKTAKIDDFLKISEIFKKKC